MIVAVVLAAGESARLGRPKQLVEHRGRSLLRHTVESATAGGCDPVVVVLGYRAGDLRLEVESTGARIVVNAAWREGMASSIRTAVRSLPQLAPGARGVLLMTCDQLRIDPDVVRLLRERFDGSPGRMVACEYADTVGVPALFERSRFADLGRLRGPGGARQILLSDPDRLVRVPWPAGAVDVDREKDLP